MILATSRLSALPVAEEAGTASLADGFAALPARLYAGDGAWIPEDAEALARAFSAANPWHTGRFARTFCVPGQARAAGFFDPSLRADDGAPAAFFGYWESDGDRQAACAVLARVAQWARDRGAATLYGPIQFNTALGYRVRLSAEPGATPFVGEPYNPSWYGDELSALGLSLARRYLTQRIDGASARVSLERYRPLQARLERRGYRFVAIDEAMWLSRLDELHALANRMFAANFAYTPIGREQFVAAYGPSLLRKLWRDLSVLALAPDGEVAGFFLVYPDYGPLVAQSAGAARLSPGALDFDRHAPLLGPRGPQRALLKTVAVHPAYRARGLAEALSAWLLERATTRCDELFGALIREDNASRRLSAGETQALRWYGLYSLALARREGTT
jgi:ribosomal protein S18 acetylase RimI-like enzyme